MMMNLMTVLVKKVFISSKPSIVCLLCPPPCGPFSIQESAVGGLSYKAKKPKALCLRLRYFGFSFLSEKNFKRPMHTETKDPSLYLCTALSRISDTVNASHHHLRHRHDNCINVSQHALLFLSRFVEFKTVFTIALSGKKHNPVFPIFFCRSCPGAVHPTRLLLGLSVHAGVKFFQEGMIIPVCFVAWHRVDVDVMNAVENAFFDIRIIPF